MNTTSYAANYLVRAIIEERLREAERDRCTSRLRSRRARAAAARMSR